ncbi:dual specificity protein phosphatase 13 isoform X2 [Monodelphis domestica]|uniref:dual specificity protein phosphatase 13 isoform X2 n=1 Tax=Monodelphis domestica TaxID=13616 RepID=UPI0024E1B22E|nr:dual specificity protein phosphatase 13 isoform X2 [Monodelphis domestica]
MSGEKVPPKEIKAETDNPDASCPSVSDLQQLLQTGKVSCSHVDEVWPNLFIGDAATANNRFELWKLGITHVLNAAHGGLYCQGGPDFYGSSVSYLGVPAHDLPDFNISAYFSSSADFIHSALCTPGAKVLVHCVVGVSRSATLVLAYLMLRQRLTLLQAVSSVKRHRWIFPNSGFLKQLCQLDKQLHETGAPVKD